ncbi:hypothetical protein H2136_18475 [Aeromonas hydrophila]|uniref:Uncharacterized protein n=1 Tax=Aeromonas hydrophila TaxID=644 RepID=A0A926FNK6_AERHY|nr:hypothetical protein [Aeromonas hydrophila]
MIGSGAVCRRAGWRRRAALAAHSLSVQSRQIYVFSHAALLGWYEGASWQSAAPGSA